MRGVEHHHGKLEESTPRKLWTVRAPSDPCWGRRLDHEQVLRWREAFRNTLEKQSQAHAVGSSSLSQAERGAHSRRPTGGRPHSPQCGHGDRVCLELALRGENRAK